LDNSNLSSLDQFRSGMVEGLKASGKQLDQFFEEQNEFFSSFDKSISSFEKGNAEELKKTCDQLSKLDETLTYYRQSRVSLFFFF